jgi:hypothetical protein
MLNRLEFLAISTEQVRIGRCPYDISDREWLQESCLENDIKSLGTVKVRCLFSLYHFVFKIDI